MEYLDQAPGPGIVHGAGAAAGGDEVCTLHGAGAAAGEDGVCAASGSAGAGLRGTFRFFTRRDDVFKTSDYRISPFEGDLCTV